MEKYLTVSLTILVLFIGGCVSPDLKKNDVTTLAPSSHEAEIETAEGGYYELISVKMSDEPRFSEKEWNEILKQIEKGEVILEDGE